MSYHRNVGHPCRAGRVAIIIVAVSASLAFAARLAAWPPADAPTPATSQAAAQAGSRVSSPRSNRRTSDWWKQVEPIDGSLRNGRWKYARKSAKNLGKTITTEAWNDRELTAILAELALYQAIAEANLERRDDAIWHWHTALNLDGSIASRDFTPYGNAGRLFAEFPLRKRGEMPPGFQDTAAQAADLAAGLASIPQPPDTKMPPVLNNTGANRQGSGDFEVELIVDNRGDLHQPVVISRHLHPVVIYSSLEWLKGMPAFEPARIADRPVSALFPLLIGFRVSPYGPHMTINPPQPIPPG